MKIEFRYYKIPENKNYLALLREDCIKIRNTREEIHVHNCLEIGYCYEGKGIIWLENTEHDFHAGSFYFIPRNFPHKIASSPETGSVWEYLYIDVDKFIKYYYGMDALTRERITMEVQREGIRYYGEDYPFMQKILLWIFEILRKQDIYSTEEISYLIWALLLEKVRRMENKVTARNTLLVINALSYIQENYWNCIKVRELADLCGLSESYFRKIFSSFVDMNPIEYINMVRIQKACGFIKKTGESTQSIAYKCGFSTTSSFCRCFRKYTGLSTGEWKESEENWEGRLLNYKVETKEGW